MRVPFDPPAGLVANETIYSVPGAWADADKMRFVDGRLQTIGGWQLAFDHSLTGVCRNILGWTNIAGVQNIAFGTHNALQVHVGGTLADITPAGLAPGAVDTSGGGPGYGTGTYGSGTYSVPSSLFTLRTWSLDTWGETLLAVPRGGTIFQWMNEVGTAAASVANAPSEISAMLVTPERQILALGCNEELSNDFNPLCVRGCDIEDPTDWTTSASNNAFEHMLEGGGHIVSGRMVGPYVAVWTDSALHQGQFLGNPEQTYRFDRIDSNCGLIGPNAACVLGGIAYWIGKDKQVRAWAPGLRPSIVQCPISKDFEDNLHSEQAAKIVAVSNSRFNEVWFFYPDSRDGDENSRFIALSVSSGAWFRGRLARTAACDSGVFSNPLAATAEGEVFHQEVGSDANGEALSWRALSTGYYLDEGEQILQIQRVRPDFRDQGQAIALSVRMRDAPQMPTRSYGPFALEPLAEKRDFRASGSIVELEFTGTGHVRFGKPTFDAIPTGKR